MVIQNNSARAFRVGNVFVADGLFCDGERTKQAQELFLGPRNFGTVSAAMPGIVALTIFFGVQSVVFTEIIIGGGIGVRVKGVAGRDAIVAQ